ncbi:MAG: DEAD/DEAH box helicase [Verrucomicrobia bacterium]|nr:DEAD/DEAH box helicase [Verrucomicrobiota bacterium]
MTFSDLGTTPPLIAALAKQHITEPTPIQRLAIPAVAEGKDVYIHAETGSGKTLAYLLPLFARLELKQDITQVVIIAPTHELAIQIQRQACDLAQNSGMPVRTLLLIGGTSLERQVEKLKKKPHIAVGSPGRIRELIEMGKLKAHTFKVVVLDEADVLLGQECVEATRKIVLAAPKSRQLVFASATGELQSSEEASSLAPEHLVLQTEPAPVNPNIEHLYFVCEERDKPDVLRRMIHAMSPERALVFVHRNVTAETVAAKLAHHKIRATDLHGAFAKADRKKAMDDFRSGHATVMIASDVAARGLDIAGVTHIFNLDAPSQSKAYIHRVGRTARAGASGTAVSLFTEPETRLVRRYQQELGIALTEVRLREGRVLPLGEVFPAPRIRR